jgi:D-3-phosphoglycerate dehydrogenase
MKIVMTQSVCREGLEIMDKNGISYYDANGNNPNNYLDLMSDADGIIVRIATCDANVIENSPNLKVIGRTGVGYDYVDVKKATEKGIPVVITPGANNRSVAEHTVATILAMSKNLYESESEFRKGNWNIRGNGKIIEIEHKTVGIIGMGNIGKIVCDLCNGLGMRVLGFDTFFSKDQIEEMGAEYCADKEELLKQSDFITVHIPLFETTRNTIAKKEFEIMKKTAFLINTSRGGIVNENDLVEALKNGEIAGASLDVYSQEPLEMNNSLFSAPNLMMTPHIAAQSKEAIVKMAEMCVNGMIAVLNGEKWPYVADKAVYEHPRWKG